MKKRTFLFVCSLVTLSSIAQNVEDYVFHERYARVNAVAEHNGFTAAGGSQYSCFQPLVHLFDQAGDLRWSIAPYTTGYGWIEDIRWESDSTLLVAGTNFLADDVAGGPTDGWVLVRIDTAGNVLAERRLAPYFGSYQVRLRSRPGGGLLANYGNALFGFDQQLDTLFTQTYGSGSFFDDLIDFRIFSDTQLILLFYNGIFLADLEGHITDTLPVEDEAMRAIEVTDAAIFAATDELVYRYDRESGTVTVISSPPSDVRMRRLYHADGYLHLLATRQGSLETVLYRLEGNDLVDVFPFFTPQRTITRMYPSEGDWLLVGQDYPETQINPYSLGYIKKLPALDAYLPGPQDVAVTDLSFVEITNFTSSEQEPGLYYLRYDLQLEMEVTNHGATIVEDLVIGSLRQGGFNCAEGRFLETHTGLNIPPGESYFFDVETSFFIYHSSPTLPVLEVMPCFFATAPNRRLDATPLDNQLCQTITSNQEPVILTEVRIFPNPAADVLYIQGEGVSEVENIYLYDSRGRLVRQAPVKDLPTVEIHRRGLPAGLYLLRLETGRSSWTRKVLFK